MSRICLIRCHYFRDTRVQREVAALLERGDSVHVLCLRDNGEPLRERLDHLMISRIPLRHRAGAGIARRLAEYLVFFSVAGLLVSALHLRRRFDLVQVNSVPDVLVFAALVPRLTGAQVLLDLQEPMPEFFATKLGIDEQHWAVRMLCAFEQASIRFADAVVTVTEPMRQRFIARGAAPDKITVVMDGADEKVFDSARLPCRVRDDGKFVLICHGTIEPQYGLDTVIRAVAWLTPAIPSLELHIVGDGSQRAELQALASRVGVADRVVFSCGFVPTDELVTMLACSDVGVVAMRQDSFRDLTLAGKMFDYIAMGVPMVVSRTRSVQETFPPGCFESFVSGDPRGLARAIQRLHDDPYLRESVAARAKVAARPYSWSVQSRRYRDVVDALLYRAATTDRGTATSDYSCDPQKPLSLMVTRDPDASRLAAWDELVRGVPGSDVTQLSAWADVRREAGFEPLYVFALRDAELLGGALVLTRKLPVVGAVGYVPYGPLIRVGTNREEVVAVLTAALRRLAHREMRAVFVQPPPGGEDVSVELRRRGFRRSDAGIAPTASLLLDLAREEDDLRLGLHKTLQRWCKTWPARGVHVRLGTEDDVALMARLHAETAQYHGFKPMPHHYIATLYRRLAPAGHAVMFIGEVEGKPVVASLLTGCGGVLTGRLTGMDRGSQAGRLHVNGAVVWEAIRWAKANKYRVFDFGGISDTAVSALENAHCDKSALTTSEAFKLTFGGTPFRFPMPVEMIYSPMIRFAYDISMRWPVGRRLVEQTAHRLRADRSQRTGGSHRGAYIGESSNPSAAVGPSHSKSMGQERG